MSWDSRNLTLNELQFRIYALFLMADGEWYSEEQKLLETVSKEMHLSESFMEETTTYCKNLGISRGDHSSTIIKEIQKAFEHCIETFLLKHDPIPQAQTVWTMINLGYADQHYSEPEKKVVQYLIQKWKIKPELVSEFTDTAETILLLTKQEDWVASAGLSYSETKRRIQTIEEQIQLMFDNIKTTISEARAI